LTGTWIAVRKGASFVRVLFLILLFVLISKLGYDIFSMVKHGLNWWRDRDHAT